VSYPTHRPGVCAATRRLRSLVRETRLTPGNLIYPCFVCPGPKVRQGSQFHAGVISSRPINCGRGRGWNPWGFPELFYSDAENKDRED